MQYGTIIVAGGTGKRMGSDIPKQFLPLAGKPLLMHTIERFSRFDAEMPIILTIPEDYITYWNRLCEEHDFYRPHTVVTGGTTRFHSVQCALTVMPEVDFIAVHDGVRPLIPVLLIERCFATAARHGSAIPVVPLVDSLRRLTDDGSVSVPREGYCLVQTPQVFRAEWLKKAYNEPYCSTFTDDASVVERAGYKLTFVDGDPGNKKITTPLDMQVAEALFFLGSH